MNLANIQLNSPETSNDAFSIWSRFREDGGITWSDLHRSWIVSDFAHVREVLLHEGSSVGKMAPFAARADAELRQKAERMQQVMRHWLPFLDPPAHTRMRRFLMRGFMPRSLNEHEAPIRKIANEILDGLSGRGEIEFMEDFASELPARAIAYLFGLPQSDTPRLKRWSIGISEFVLGSDKPGRYANSLGTMQEMQSCFAKLVEKAPRGADAGDGPLMKILLAAREEEDGLTDDEVVATLVLIMFAAPETTANMLLNAMYSLVRWPEQLALLRQNPEMFSRALEELIRYDGPVPAVVRVAGQDMEIGGKSIRKGERIFLLLKSANRDTTQFDRPDQLILERERSPHLGFGSGIHLCVGAPLARLEARIAFEELLKRYEAIHLPEQVIEWRSELLAHSPKALRLVVEPRI